MTEAVIGRADPSVRAATRAVYAAFIGAGFTFASWASRIPEVRDRFVLDPAQLGLLLICIAVGSIVALVLSGPVVSRFGSRRTVTVMAVLGGLSLITVAIGYQTGVVGVVIGLLMLGFGSGAWDVAMNVQGAIVEQRLGQSIMSRFHAGYSLGTVIGALLGAGMVLLKVPVSVHLSVAGVLVAVLVPLAAQRFVPDTADGSVAETNPKGSRSALSAWREPRTLLIGVFVLAFTFAEGTGNDWIGVALIDGHAAAAATGTLGFAAFLTAMSAARWFGPGLLDRYGRVPVLRTFAVIGVIGVALFVFVPNTPVAFVGALLWGVGVSLGFPVGMSAAADEDPTKAAARVSVVASLGYCAFLAGPPLIGFLGLHYGVLRSLTAVAALLAIAVLLTGSVRPVRKPEQV